MWDSNSRSYSLGMRVNGQPLWDKCRCGVPNITNGKLRVIGVIVGDNDGILLLDLQLEHKEGRRPTKEQIAFVKAYLLGVAEGADSSSQLIGNGIPLIAASAR